MVQALLRRTSLAVATAVLMMAGAGASGASAATPAPFGHACTVQNGVRFCPTTDLASRPHSFDGTPIDVDVTLPATGNGPFPTILLLHGLGGTKASFEGATGNTDYNNIYFAQHGYAVVTPTARGFGNSCGVALSRTSDCSNGYTRLADMRYEVRDIQTLVGQLVDEKIVKPNAIGSTGVSYGGGMSMMLAFLHNRIRLLNGAYAPWRSPDGTAISLTAAWPRWPWSNGESIFSRNGRAPWSQNPIGVEAQAYAGAIFGVGASGYTEPLGGPLDADILLWKQQLDAGVVTAAERKTEALTYKYHGVAGVPGKPSPLLIQSGWTDGLFPVGQALGAYDHILAQNSTAPVALQFGDLGHAPASNHVDDELAFARQGLNFFNSWLLAKGSKLKPGSVTAYTVSCPASAKHGGGPYTADTYGDLSHSAMDFTSPKSLNINWKGASTKLAAAVSPLATTGNRCTAQKPDPTSHATFSEKVSTALTLIGQSVITGKVVTHGKYGQLDARLWDLNPHTHTERLVDRGAYRLNNNQRGTFKFTLDGDGWKFAKGDRIVVELLGRDAPTYGPSPDHFSAKLTKVAVSMPTR